MTTFCSRAIDIGYGNTKLVVDGKNKCASFPSLAEPVTQALFNQGFYSKPSAWEVLVNGTHYRVGELVSSSCASVVHEDFITTPQHVALFHAALNVMRAAHIDLLVTGLPVHLFQAREQQLAALLRGRHEVQAERFVTVENVLVVPQPMGGLFQQRKALDSSALTLVVDIGHYSFDWLVSRGLTTRAEQIGSVPLGVSHFVARIAEELTRRTGVFSLALAQHIDSGLRTGQFTLFGKPTDLAPYREAGDAVLDRAVLALKNSIGAGHSIQRIVLLGGGAPHFCDAIQRQYPSHELSIVDEPMYANVRGFQAIARAQAQRQARSV